MNRIRAALPKGARVTIKKKMSGALYIDCQVFPSIESEMFELCKQWQREILKDLIYEFYTEETGSHWKVFLKRGPFEFHNVEPYESPAGTLIKNGKLQIA